MKRRWYERLSDGAKFGVILSTQIFVWLIVLSIKLLNESVPYQILIAVTIIDLYLITLLIMLFIKSRKYKSTILALLISSGFMLLYFTWFYQLTGVYTEDLEVTYDAYTCFYFSVITWTSLGYGDVSPTYDSRAWVMIEVLVGYFHMSVFVGLILEAIISHNRKINN